NTGQCVGGHFCPPCSVSKGGMTLRHPLEKLLFLAPIVSRLIVVAVFISTSSAAAQESQALSLESRIPLPNVNGRIDHLRVDVKGQRLFVAAVDNHTLEVVDLKSGQRVHTITDLAEPQGVFYDASTNRVRTGWSHQDL